MANPVAAAIVVLSLETALNALPQHARALLSMIMLAMASAAILMSSTATTPRATTKTTKPRRRTSRHARSPSHASSAHTPMPAPTPTTTPTPTPARSPPSPTPLYTHAAYATAGAAVGLSAAEMAPDARRLMLALMVATSIAMTCMPAGHRRQRRRQMCCGRNCSRRTRGRGRNRPADMTSRRTYEDELRIAAAVPLPDSDMEL